MKFAGQFDHKTRIIIIIIIMSSHNNAELKPP